MEFDKKTIGIIATLIIIAVLGYVYFFIISPTFIEKPDIEKTNLTDTVSASHITSLVNDLGAYKLHPDLSGELPEIEIILTDTNQIFSAIVENNIPEAKEVSGTNPDIRISMTSAKFIELYNSQDFNSKIIELYNEGSAQLELLKDEITLAEKGYKAIYDNFS